MSERSITEIEICGTVEPGFEAVREAFVENFHRRREVGAATAVVVDGRTVVDLWAGLADADGRRPWQRDTLANVYSTTKGIAAVCLLALWEQGKVDLDAPVVRYWPEFGAAGKEQIPVRWLLDHSAGLPAVREPLPEDALFDWGAMTGALAAEEPWWTPGTQHGYHAVTYAWTVGEVIRRASGQSVGSFLRERIAGPLGLDLHIGLAADEDARCARLIAPLGEPVPEGEPALFEMVLADPSSVTARAFMNPPSLMLPGTVNSRAWRGAEIPSANGHATARALAGLYGVLGAGGSRDAVHVLSPATIDAARTEQRQGPDAVLQVESRFGLGFMLAQPHMPLGPNERAFGHPGAGGSLGFADPEARVGFGYTMNRMGPHILIDPRPRALIDAVYACL